MPPAIVPELIVSDIRKSLAFYRDLLEFQIRYERPEERFVFLKRGAAALMLEQPHSRDRLWPKAELTHPYGRGMNLELGVDNVDQLHAAARDAGVHIRLPLEEKWYRREQNEVGVCQFAIEDPDGYLIRLSQDIGLRAIAT